MTEHTPTPWMASNQYLYADNRTLPVASGQQDWATNPGAPNYQEACANAAFIVKAVNCHKILVKVLESIAEFSSGDDTTLGALSRLASIRNTAVNILNHVEPPVNPSAPGVSTPARRPPE